MTIEEALASPTISVPDAGKLFFGLGKDSSYEAARTGEIETIRIGGRILVPVAPLAAKLGLRTRFGEAALWHRRKKARQRQQPLRAVVPNNPWRKAVNTGIHSTPTPSRASDPAVVARCANAEGRSKRGFLDFTMPAPFTVEPRRSEQSDAPDGAFPSRDVSAEKLAAMATPTPRFPLPEFGTIDDARAYAAAGAAAREAKLAALSEGHPLRRSMMFAIDFDTMQAVASATGYTHVEIYYLGVAFCRANLIPQPDAELVELECELLAAWTSERVHARSYRDDRSLAADRALAFAAGRVRKIVDEIAGTKATSLRGLQVKALAATWLREGDPLAAVVDPQAPDAGLLASLVGDLHAMRRAS